jgi:site-specific recombinase XerD
VKGEDQMKKFFKDIKTLEPLKEGPLGPYTNTYLEHLQAQGYTRQSVCRMLRLVVGFSRWLGRQHLTIDQITLSQVRDYLRFRKRSGYQRQLGDPSTLIRLLQLLDKEGYIALSKPPLAITPSEVLLQQYDAYLQQERCLAMATRKNYLPFVRRFLLGKFGQGPSPLRKLSAADVIHFVQRNAAKLAPKRAKLMTAALRSFLRFAQYRGDLRQDLATGVPSVAGWSCSTVPKAMPPAQIKQVLAACNRRTDVGRRDYAILLLLARLGLRGGEVAHLMLEDIDWERGYLKIQGKASHVTSLPLPAEVGQAIVAYLRKGRPKGSSQRRLFLRARAPVTGFKGQVAVGSVVRHALIRAGIDSPHKGSHQFRHALACQMLREGHSLHEIGEILRHRSPNTTTIYAKVDFIALRALALPWPGGGQ